MGKWSNLEQPSFRKPMETRIATRSSGWITRSAAVVIRLITRIRLLTAHIMCSESSIFALYTFPLRFHDQSVRGLLIALALESNYSWAGHVVFLFSGAKQCRHHFVNLECGQRKWFQKLCRSCLLTLDELTGIPTKAQVSSRQIQGLRIEAAPVTDLTTIDGRAVH
jgi:hypothetical protein